MPTATPLPGPVGVAVPKDFQPQSASFVSDRTGWVLGVAAFPSRPGTEVPMLARTRDGGRTWRAFAGPRTASGNVAQVRFANLSDGFVTGTELWATHDGGVTWKVVPGYGGTVVAASAGRVWVVREQSLLSAPVAGGAFVTEQKFAYDFALRGQTVAFHPDGHFRVLEVAEPGQPIRQLAEPCDEGDRSVIALGKTHWLLVCEGDAGLGHQAKQAFRSEDHGRTWQPNGEPPPLTGTDTYITSDGDFVVDHQQVAVYREGRWQTALASDGGLSEAGFESAVLGFAIGGFDNSADAVLKVTRDAGRTWSTVAFS